MVHALNDLRSSGISLDSKSSIYEFPALEIALEWPGTSWANSPKKESDEGVLVSSRGILSIIFVRICDWVLYEVFSPQMVFDIGSSPKLTFCVYGLSVRCSIVPRY